MARPMVLWLGLALLVSGCADPPQAPVDQQGAVEDAATDDQPGPEDPVVVSSGKGQGDPPGVVTEYTFKGTIDLRTPTAGTEHGDDSWQQEIPVDERTTRVVATLTWTSPGEAQDVDLYVSYPGCQEHPDGCIANWFVAGIMDGAAKVDADGGPGAPDSPAQVTLEQAEIQARLECNGFADSCPWRVGVIDDARTYAAIDFTLVVRIESLSP